jgi:hypothetical protein
LEGNEKFQDNQNKEKDLEKIAKSHEKVLGKLLQ